jgi:hypothetical protein
MKEAGTDFVTVLCTGQLVKFDMAVGALREAGIAHQVRAETSTGLKVAMPVIAAPGPGRFFTILVPANVESEARQVLSELPFEITTNPGSWDFEPQPTVKGWLKVFIIGVVALLLLYWIVYIIGILR